MFDLCLVTVLPGKEAKLVLCSVGAEGGKEVMASHVCSPYVLYLGRLLRGTTNSCGTTSLASSHPIVLGFFTFLCWVFVERCCSLYENML
jgi:hypothetical protein